MGYQLIGVEHVSYISKKDNQKKDLYNYYVADTSAIDNPSEDAAGVKILTEYNSFKQCRVIPSYTEEDAKKVGIWGMKVNQKLIVIFDRSNSPVYYMKA